MPTLRKGALPGGDREHHHARPSGDNRPTAEPTETLVPPTEEPTVAPEPTATAAEAPAEVADEPVAAAETESAADSEDDDSNTWLIVVIGVGLIAAVIAVIFYLLKGRE